MAVAKLSLDPGHMWLVFGGDAVVKPVSIEDRRARERADRRHDSGKRHDQVARLVKGKGMAGWREALGEFCR